MWKHGLCNTSTHSIWQHMVARCHGVPPHKDYGGRGITVCDRWRESFTNFLTDMGERPSPELSIDRIDNDGHYKPGNCRWATKAEQSLNRRNNRRITIDGRTLTLIEWCREYGVTDTLVGGRLRLGWAPLRALQTPPRHLDRELTWGERTLPISAWARELGMALSTIATRLERGWPVDKALGTARVYKRIP